jgi:hypothetical protein
MRLFGKVNGTMDRFDRAWLLTPPFDKNLSIVVGVLRVVAVEVYAHGMSAAEVYRHGTTVGEVFVHGAASSEAYQHGVSVGEAYVHGATATQVEPV